MDLLISTGDSPIVEISRKDPFWGAMPIVDSGELVGHNVLGQLLMEMRDFPYALLLGGLLPLQIQEFTLFGSPIGVQHEP